MATEDAIEQGPSVEAVSTEDPSQGGQSVEAVFFVEQDLQSESDSYGNLPETAWRQATTKNWSIGIPVNLSSLVPQKLQHIKPAALRFQPRIIVKQNYVGCHFNVHLGENINQGLMFKYKSSSLSFQFIEKQTYLTLSSEKKFGNFQGNFSGHAIFPFTGKKALFLENSKIFVQTEKNLNTPKLTSNASINLYTFSKKKFVKKQAKIDNLPVTRGTLSKLLANKVKQASVLD